MEFAGKRFIFIGGLHRSGTSLLHRTLQAHPSISGFSGTGASEDEGQHLQTVFPPAAAYGGAGKFCFSPEAHMDETSPLATEENRQKLLGEWGKHWDMNKPILVEKSPPNLVRMRFLQAMFPNSQFIITMRHPFAGGYATQKWSKTSFQQLVGHWLSGHIKMLDDLPHISRWRVIRYEDFVENPNAVLADLYQWIGLEPEPVRAAVNPQMNSKYFARWEREAIQSLDLSSSVQALDALPEKFGYIFTPPYTRAWSGMAKAGDSMPSIPQSARTMVRYLRWKTGFERRQINSQNQPHTKQ